MGHDCFSKLIHSTGTHRANTYVSIGHDERECLAVPAPDPFIGQVRAAPPAVDQVVAGEIVLAGDNRSPELGQTNLALPVAMMTSHFILFERRLAQPENQRRWTLCQIVQ